MLSIRYCLVYVLLSLAGCKPVMNLQLSAIGNRINTSLRGMSIPTDKVIWVSGSNGTVGRSTDEGNTWQWNVVKGYEKRDFRDIEAFDGSTAVIMAIDNPATLLKTTDGGRTWTKTFEKQAEGMFLDAMDFSNKQEGICIGDPLVDDSGKKFFYLLRTHDGGNTWEPDQSNKLSAAQPNEAIFSASGTNIFFLNHAEYEFAFVTGGALSNLMLIGKPGIPNQVINIPIVQGAASAGTFSVATDRNKHFYCIGGDYKEPENTSNNFVYTNNAGKSWMRSTGKPPSGYRSCIRMLRKNKLIACGTNGVDLSTNGGKNWVNISKQGFNVCMENKHGNQVFFAGNGGKIASIRM